MLPHLLAFTLTLVPSLVSAALYPRDSLVKTIDTKGFRNVMKENRTSVVAFVASWCGYCKAMVPEYTKAALGLHPLVPLYAIDCDENRSLCAEQNVKGFPTVKLFPRGKDQAPILFEHPERTASTFFYFATRRVPHKNKKLYQVEDIEPWVNEKMDRTRVLLLSKAKDLPLMWKVLANKYRDDFAFASHRDRKGKSSVALGYDSGTQKDSKILIYPTGSTKPFLFQGVLKYDSISKFFDEVLDGTVTLTSSGSQSPEDGHKLSPEEEDIERKQEAQRLALLHGGFADMIDFDEAIKKHGAGFHGEHGYSASLDDELKNDPTRDTNKAEYEHEREEDPIHRAIRIQREEQAISEAQTAAETPPLSTVNESNGTPQASPGTSTSESTVGLGVAPSETAHVKDEL
ncbi:hypothetical protein BGW80DRAFT_1338369 [Lactifluus volemus]|nr:hypothetical protein BGW80DRAFT_1338369 [Lactifluus volemus]